MARPTLPDALTAADSARGVVLATCIRGSTEALPALFRVESRLGGAVPDTFTAYPPFGIPRGGVPLRAGYRYALLLRDVPPPAGPEFRRVFQWREPAQFEVWHSDVVRPEAGGTFGDSAASALYAAIWSMPQRRRSDQVSTLAAWARSGGPALSWAGEVVERHPGVWGEPLRDFFLERLKVGRDLNQEWAARQLAMHPDTTTRAEFLRLASGDSLTKKLAIILGSRDRTPWVRQVILTLGEESLSGLPGPLPNFFDWRAPHSERWGPILRTLSALTEALSPDSSAAERRLLIRIAEQARLDHWLRYAALRPLARDTSAVVRGLIWQTVRGDSASRSVSIEDAPEPDEVTPYWTADELHLALQDTSFRVRYYAYGEVSRRRDLQAADTILVWLQRNRVPGRADIPLAEAGFLIRTLGDTRSPVALDALMAWGKIPEEHVHMAVMDALRSLGDRRGAPFFRRLARVPCTQMDSFAARSLASGLAELGDEADVWLCALWARECPNIRDEALEAVGMLGGVPRMIEAIRQVETGPMTPERARDYELLEARVRERTAQRRGADAR